MEQKLRALIAKIKELVVLLEESDIHHQLLDSIYEYCDEMEDVIYHSDSIKYDSSIDDFDDFMFGDGDM
jgi:hypothetical protein